MTHMTQLTHITQTASRASRIPTGLKLAYTAYVAVLIPVYWHY
jgi:hypothetical protein